MPVNLNAPEHWLAWLRACQKDSWSAKQLGPLPPLGALTGQDKRALGAIAACWSLYAVADNAGRAGVRVAVRALLDAVQGQCWPFARALIAQSLEWSDRDLLWLQIDPPF